MCDLPHRRTLLSHFPGKDELNPRIGIIIRKHFRKDAPPRDLSKASPAGQYLLRAESSRASGFHTIGIRQISVTKQCNGRVLTDPIRLQKIPNLKALFPKVSSGILQ